MIDADLKTQLDEVNKNLVAIEKKRSPGIWRAFFNGIFSAFGYLVGLLFVVVVLGWILQKTGTLNAFKEQMKVFSDLANQARKFTSPSDNSEQAPTSTTNSGGETTITLPNGQQYRINTSEQYP